MDTIENTLMEVGLASGYALAQMSPNRLAYYLRNVDEKSVYGKAFKSGVQQYRLEEQAVVETIKLEDLM